MNFRKTKNPFKSTLLFGAFSGLRSGISLLLLPIFLNYLSPEDYGIISLVIIYSTIVAVVGSLGLKSALYTFYFDFDKKDTLRKYLSHLFSVHLISFSAITVIHLLIGDSIYELLFASQKVSFNNYGLIALLSIFFDVLNSLYFVFLKNEVNLKVYFKYTLSIIILTACFQIVFITQFGLKINGWLMGTLIPNAIILMVILFSNPSLIRLNFNKKLLYPSLNYSLKLLPFLLFFAFENQIDKYLIELNLGLKNVGLYTLLIKIFGILIIAINAVDDGIRPFLYRDLKGEKATTTTYFNLYIAFSVFILVIINIIGCNLEHIIKNEDYLVIKDYFFLGSMTFLLIIPIRFYGLLLVYYKESLKLSIVTTIKVVFLVLLMLVLIPKYKLYGALYAVSISNLINIIVFAFILHKKVTVLPHFKAFIFILFFVVSTYYLHSDMSNDTKPLLSLIYASISITLLIWFYKKDGITILKSKF